MNKLFRIVGIVILGATIFWLACFMIPHKVEYRNENEFRQAGGNLFFEIPDKAEECYYSIYKTSDRRISYVSFSLDSDSSKLFIKKM